MIADEELAREGELEWKEIKELRADNERLRALLEEAYGYINHAGGARAGILLDAIRRLKK